MERGNQWHKHLHNRAIKLESTHYARTNRVLWFCGYQYWRVTYNTYRGWQHLHEANIDSVAPDGLNEFDPVFSFAPEGRTWSSVNNCTG